MASTTCRFVLLSDTSTIQTTGCPSSRDSAFSVTFTMGLPFSSPPPSGNLAYIHVPRVDCLWRWHRQEYGIVLDIGAGKVTRSPSDLHRTFISLPGHGRTAKYLDPTRVTKYVALEPNVLMHHEIRRAADAAGFSEAADTFVLLACGAEDTTTILTSLGGYQPVDTFVSVLTLCSVPEPRETIRPLTTEVLKPGGQLLFIEHVRNLHPHIVWWQRFWSPLWALAFDGCTLNRPTHLWVQQVGILASEEVASAGVDGEDEERQFWHRVGKYVNVT